MKKIHYYLCAFLLAIFCSSCEDDFDAKIYGSYSTINFPQTEEDYENYMITCYLPFGSNWQYSMDDKNANLPFYDACVSIARFFDTPTDITARVVLAENPDHRTERDLWNEIPDCNFSNFFPSKGMWDGGTIGFFNKVQDITRMTKIMGDLQKAEVISEDKKKEWIAEVHLLRGMTMYYLLHFFGPVPVILEPELVDSPEAQAKLERPTLEFFVDAITADFKAAIADIPDTQKSQGGRYNKDYARFCLMRHYLNEGHNDKELYTEAVKLYNDLQGKYALFTNGQNAYVEQFYSANRFNEESIMEVYCTLDPENYGGNYNPFIAYTQPSTGIDLSKLEGGWGQAFNVSRAFYDTFEAGDLRKETIITSCTDKKDPTKIYDVTTLSVNWDGYILNKFPAEVTDYYQPIDVPLARWADVLLMAAEANVRANGSVSGADLDNLNQVRTRAGLSNITTTDKDAFLEAILTERGHELFYEGCRKIDLIRFGKYYTTMSALGRTPTSQYYPIPAEIMDKAGKGGYNLKQYYFRADYEPSASYAHKE